MFHNCIKQAAERAAAGGMDQKVGLLKKKPEMFDANYQQCMDHAKKGLMGHEFPSYAERNMKLQKEMDGVLEDKGPEAYIRAREEEANGGAWPRRHHALFIVANKAPDNYGKASQIITTTGRPSIGPAGFLAFMKFKESGTHPEYEDFARKQYEATGSVKDYNSAKQNNVDRLKELGVISAVGLQDWMHIDVDQGVTTPSHIHHHDFIGGHHVSTNFSDQATLNSLKTSVLKRAPLNEWRPDNIRMLEKFKIEFRAFLGRARA